MALRSARVLHPVPRQLPLSHEATAIAVSADGKRLAASALENGRTVLYDLRVGRVLFRFGASATAIAFSPDGTRLVTATDDRRIPSSRGGAEALRLGRASAPPPSSPISTTSLRSSEERGRSVRVWD